MNKTAKAIVVLLVLLIVIGVVGAVFAARLIMTKNAANTASSNGATTAPTTDAPDATAPPAGPTTEPGKALDRIKAHGELRVIMDTGTPAWVGSPPMYFPNEKGEPDGFDYQLALQISKDIGVPKVKIIHHLYDDFESSLTANEDADMVIGGYTPYNASGIAWSDSYLEYGLCLIVRADSKIETTADLTGKVISIFPDEAAEAQVNHLVKGYKKLVKLDTGYWDQLVSGQIDAFLYDYPFAVAEILTWYEQNPQRVGSFRIAQYNLTDSTYAVAVRKGDTDLLASVNKSIAAWRASDAYAAAIKKYLSSKDLPESAPVTGGYTVVVGDTLGSIATKVLGSGDRWKDIWALNRERFPNPNLIEVGDTLVMPADASSR